MFNAWGICLGVVRFFLWKLFGVFFLVLMLIISVSFLLKELLYQNVHYVFAFWLFVGREVLIFCSLFLVCLWNERIFTESISVYKELPFLGCFLLIGSSITVSAFHSWVCLRGGYFFLLLTLLLGLGFVVLQMFEFYECECDWFYSVYYAASFSTVGLHFLHVVAGLVGLRLIFFLGQDQFKSYYMSVVVWYWHFVDYVWLVVYFIVYLC